MAGRVLVINWQDLAHPLAGGAEVHLHQVFGRLARRGWDITLLVSGFKGARRRDVWDGLRIFRVGSRNTFNFFVPFAYRELAAKIDFELVVDDLNKIPFYSPLFARRPVVALVHHFFDRSIFLETWALPAAYVYVSEKFVPSVYRKCWFGAVSESTRRDLIERGVPAQKIHIVPNGVDVERYGPDESERSPHPMVGYLGRLKRYKSIDHVIRAFQQIRQHVPEAELLIVGDGDDRDRLEKLAAELGVEDCVVFTGRVDDQTKVTLLRRMWVCVNPSPREGWGLTVTEANACGTPVVAANSPGLRDSVRPGETGFLYEYGNVQELTERVIELLQDQSLRRRMASAAFDWARLHSWERATDCAEELLQAALCNSRQEE